ncbi:MAG: VCBS repeat-containing protein [Holophagales bacterium]|nr:MAG: VCBS repeat-containing protein [Holophagales bacterium]
MLTSHFRSTFFAFLIAAAWSSFAAPASGQLLPFDQPFLAPTNDVSWRLVVQDIDGDGLPDVSTAGPSHGQVLFGDRTSLLRVGPSFLTGAPVSLAAGDLNEDGFGDFAWASSDLATAYVNLSDGAGGYHWYQALEPSPLTPETLEIRDCNGDGHRDVAATSVGWLGGGDGTFTSGSGCLALHAVVGDFDGDAWPDRARAVYNGFTNTIRIRVALGTAGGLYGTEFDGPLLPPQTSLPFVGDADGDGLDDLVIVHYGVPKQIGIARSVGGGAFADSVFTLFPDGPSQGAAMDIDGDGRTEFVFSSSFAPRAHFFRGAVTDGLIEYATLDLPATSDALVIADLARDGAPELVVDNGPNSGLWVYPNRRGFLIDVPTLDPHGLTLLGLLVAAAGCLLLHRARP